MKIVDIRHRAVPISRYAPEVAVAPALDTTIVAIVADRMDGGAPLTGYGFASFGRFAQDGLIRDRFAPRLLGADPTALLHPDGVAIDPLRACDAMMAGEKPGGHGDRSVAVGALDMALWDLAAKARGLPLYRLLSEVFERDAKDAAVPVYASGGYPLPNDDLAQLRAEAQRFREIGFTASKIKIGAGALAQDCWRIETVLEEIGDGARLAIDAMNRYTPAQALEAARAFEPYRLKWFEDICDPLDFETHRRAAARYRPPLSAGEAIFSASDARNLLRYGGLRPGHDVLTFDRAHCYGVGEYARIIALFEAAGWSARDFQPHGGHLYGLHVAAGFGLGGCECNPLNFQPLGGFGDDTILADGSAAPPEAPGVGFETRGAAMDLFASLA